jgi:hypothetical protein
MQGRDGVKAAITENVNLHKKLLNDVRTTLGIETRSEISTNNDKQKEKTAEATSAKAKSKQ